MKNDISFKGHDLFAHMDSVKKEMANEYMRIQKRSKEDPGTAGDQGEENWADFFRGWLPANYHVVTKGRIIDAKGKSSPQVDILILHPSYPKKLHNSKHYFAGGVIAAFECKLTLKKADVDKACKNSVIIKGMLPIREGNPYDELQQPILYGLLAHSHSWKKEDSLLNLLEVLHEQSPSCCEHPREMIDVVCLADSATYSLEKKICVGNIDTSWLDEMPFNNPIVTGYYMSSERKFENYDPTGEIFCSLVTKVFEFMAFEDPALRQLADYFKRTSIYGGLGKITYWDENVLSKNVLKQLKLKGYQEMAWSKWAQDC